METASRVIGVAKFSPTSTTETNIWNTHGAWTKATGSTLVTCVTAPSRSETVCASTSYMCTRNTDLTNAVSVASGFRNHQALTSILEYTAGKGPTNVLTASKHSQPRPFWGLTSDSTAARNHLNAVTAGKHLHRTRRMTVTWDARTRRRSPAFVSSVARRLHSRTNSNSTWTCIQERNHIHVRSAVEASLALRLAIATDQTSIALLGKIERRRWCERVRKVTKVIWMEWKVI